MFRRRKHNPVLSMFLMFGLPMTAKFDRPDGDGSQGGGGGSANPELERARSELEASARQIAELNDKISKMGSNVVSDDDKRLLAQLKKEKEDAETKRLAEQGEFKRLLDKANEDLAAANKAREDSDRRAKQQVADLRLTNLLEREIPRHTEIPPVQIIGALGLKDYFVFNETTGAFTITDPITKAAPRNTNGTAMTPEEFIAKRIADTPWAASMKPKGGSGSQTVEGGGSGEGGEFTSEDIANMSIEEFNKHRDTIFSAADKNTRPAFNPTPNARPKK